MQVEQRKKEELEKYLVDLQVRLYGMRDTIEEKKNTMDHEQLLWAIELLLKGMAENISARLKGIEKL